MDGAAAQLAGPPWRASASGHCRMKKGNMMQWARGLGAGSAAPPAATQLTWAALSSLGIACMRPLGGNVFCMRFHHRLLLGPVATGTCCSAVQGSREKIGVRAEGSVNGLWHPQQASCPSPSWEQRKAQWTSHPTQTSSPLCPHPRDTHSTFSPKTHATKKNKNVNFWLGREGLAVWLMWAW